MGLVVRAGRRTLASFRLRAKFSEEAVQWVISETGRSCMKSRGRSRCSICRRSNWRNARKSATQLSFRLVRLKITALICRLERTGSRATRSLSASRRNLRLWGTRPSRDSAFRSACRQTDSSGFICMETAIFLR